MFCFQLEEMVLKVSIDTQMPSVMSAREGDRIYVVERLNQDWWFVRKKITNQTGFVPAEMVVDSVSYTYHIDDTINKMIDSKISATECMYLCALISNSICLINLILILNFNFNFISAAELTLTRVASEPSFVTIPHSEITTKMGERLTIEFTIAGSPRPYLTCFKESNIIETNEKFHLYINEDNRVSIVFDDILPYDSGLYTIVAKNNVGYTKFSFNISVEGIWLFYNKFIIYFF